MSLFDTSMRMLLHVRRQIGCTPNMSSECEVSRPSVWLANFSFGGRFRLRVFWDIS